MDLSAQFKKSWAGKTAFLPEGGTVLLAVSGGLDSMVMAHLCLQAGIPAAVGHCNFRLRGEESDSDEAFVSAWCVERGIPFHAIGFDTAAITATRRKGIQETARELRYEWLASERARHGYAAILTAHHADDNAETLLINLCRGTGIGGLHGIPERNGHVIRPLLFATREDLARYAARENVPYREDRSNATDDYLRNVLRHQVLPVLEERLPGVALRLLQTSRNIVGAEVLYRKEVERQRRKLLLQRGADYYIPVRLLRQREALETLLYELTAPFGFTAAQLPGLVSLLDAETGRYIASPACRIIKNRDFLIITALASADTGFILVDRVPSRVETAAGTFHFAWSEVPEAIPPHPHTAWLDAGRLTFPLILRQRRTGDYFYPLGMGMKKKKVSRFLTDQKVPLHEKESCWVLESAKRIAWVAGRRIDERFRAVPGTQRLLQVRLTPRNQKKDG